MAEIKIEKKSPVWPWILAAIIIIGLILYFLVFRDDVESNKDTRRDANDTEQVDTTGRAPATTR